MRKTIISEQGAAKAPAASDWLDLDALAEVEITSENPEHPIEAALHPSHASGGWRASGPGEQKIRLKFPEPQRVRRIRLVFEETETARTQEFALSWASAEGASPRGILRQQYGFSPPGTTREIEEYRVELDGVRTLELAIRPEIGGGGAVASLVEWRVG